MSDNHTFSHLADQLYNDYFKHTDSIEDFQILSTIRYDPNISKSVPENIDSISIENFFLLPEHVQRLQFTSEFFNYTRRTLLEFDLNSIFHQLVAAIKESKAPVNKPLRVRLLVSLDGEVAVELYETIDRPDLLIGLLDSVPEEEIWDVYVDTTQLMMSPFTSFKTTNRPHYDDYRKRALPGNRVGKEEVVFGNVQNALMEGSITNIAVKRNGEWITPKLQTGCLCGVTRHLLLSKGYIKEDSISINDLSEGEPVLLSNGVIGVVRGRIKQIV